MSEKYLVINGLQLNYKGVFEYSELMKTIFTAVESRGYRKHEKKHEETIKPEGKEIFIELRPLKTKTAYMTLMVKMRITLSNIQDIVVEVDGVPTNVQQGEINIVFDAWTTTDYENRWGNKAWFYFLKSLINKYVYTFPLESGFMGEVADDTRYVYNQVRSALGLYKYKVKQTSE